MKLGTPKDYAHLYRISFTDEYKRQLLRWLDEQQPGFSKLVEKELARNPPAKGKKGRVEVDGRTEGAFPDADEV